MDTAPRPDAHSSKNAAPIKAAQSQNSVCVDGPRPYHPVDMRIGKSPEIVVTLGPASRTAFRSLRDAGAAVFRLNSSHMSAQALAGLAGDVRRALPDCALVIDLQGAKMRLGEFEERPVHAGAPVHFSLSGSGGAVPLPHPEFFEAVSVGETLGCDDDRIRFRVMAAGAGSLETVSVSSGILRPRKGVNVIEHPVVLKGLSAADTDCVRAAALLGHVAFAFSFMKDGSESEWIRRMAPGCRVIGKIERREAASSAARIAGMVDEIWICRGDLGAQLGPASMARWISTYDPRAAQRPVFMAGQVLEHLTRHAIPTRAEVCHLYDLVRRGYAGFVLSDETAIGIDPEGAVRTLRTLLEEFCREP